jgi:hypothetical protein
MDCFAEPVIGQRFALTRWLAMTMLRHAAKNQNLPPGDALVNPGLGASRKCRWKPRSAFKNQRVPGSSQAIPFDPVETPWLI